MGFITAIRQRWKRAVGVSLTIALLSAVTVVGITFLGSEALAAWKAPANSEQALVPDSAFAGLLNFEAPADKVVRLTSETEEVEKNKAQDSSNPLLTKNWKFTQNTLVDNIIKSYQLYFQSVLLQVYEHSFLTFLNILAMENPALAPVIQLIERQAIQLYTIAANILAIQQMQINAQIPPALRPPATLPASPHS